MLVVVCLLAVGGLVVALWGSPRALLDPLDRGHGGDEVEQLDPDVVEDRGVGPAIGDLHGHLNYAIWGQGPFDEGAWLDTLDQIVERVDDDGVAEALTEARELVTEEAGLYAAHGALETAELRYANVSG